MLIHCLVYDLIGVVTTVSAWRLLVIHRNIILQQVYQYTMEIRVLHRTKYNDFFHAYIYLCIYLFVYFFHIFIHVLIFFYLFIYPFTYSIFIHLFIHLLNFFSAYKTSFSINPIQKTNFMIRRQNLFGKDSFLSFRLGR
jgi:hypothetical protein